VSVRSEICKSWCVSEDRNILEFVCQLRPKYLGNGVSVKMKYVGFGVSVNSELFRSWCVSED